MRERICKELPMAERVLAGKVLKYKWILKAIRPKVAFTKWHNGQKEGDKIPNADGSGRTLDPTVFYWAEQNMALKESKSGRP